MPCSMLSMQTLGDVEIRIPLNAGFPVKAKHVEVVMKKGSLKAGLCGKDPILNGDLSHNVSRKFSQQEGRKNFFCQDALAEMGPFVFTTSNLHLC